MRNWFSRAFRNSGSAVKDTSPGDVFSALRNQALATQRTEVGISQPTADAPVWGVLMETGYAGAIARLFTLADGTTSLYFSNGGGVIGGGAYKNVQDANAAFIKTANRFLPKLKPCESFPVPGVGHTIFYVLTDSGVYSSDSVREDVLGQGSNQFSPLFYSGQGVITQLRVMSESK
jgi:hypothetical protein